MDFCVQQGLGKCCGEDAPHSFIQPLLPPCPPLLFLPSLVETSYRRGRCFWMQLDPEVQGRD